MKHAKPRAYLTGNTVRPHLGPNDATVTRTAAGLVVDGALTPLEGEPPIARSNGWGQRPGRP